MQGQLMIYMGGKKDGEHMSNQFRTDHKLTREKQDFKLLTEYIGKCT